MCLEISECSLRMSVYGLNSKYTILILPVDKKPQTPIMACIIICFLDDHAPAFNYRVGGYKFQVVDGKETP